MQTYLVGGAVRNLLLGKDIADRDYLVRDVSEQAFTQLFAHAQKVGHAFPVFLIDHQEFAFPRAPSLLADLKARDLTVNAVLLDDQGELICHPHSLDDLHNRVLRPASDSSLLEDPLRIFRAARFWATYPEFSIHSALLQQMVKANASDALAALSPDRVGQEVRKALASKRPSNFFRLLIQGDCLEPWLSPLKRYLRFFDNKKKHLHGVLKEKFDIMDAVSGEEIRAWMAFYQLFSPSAIGDDASLNAPSDNQAIVVPENLAQAVRLPNKLTEAGKKSVRWKQVAYSFSSACPYAKVDMLMDLHEKQSVIDMFSIVQAATGEDYTQEALESLDRILQVRLPSAMMNQGETSGRHLREMRAQELSKECKI